MTDAVAVLVSGGLDSAVLTVDLARQYAAVHPLYLRHGLHWEEEELRHLRRFLGSVDEPRIRPVSVLEMPVADIYGRHWSVSGEGVPDEATPDDAVYLPGRNLFFLAKAGVWCERHGVPSIALAPLSGNPFADNTEEFYRGMEEVLRLSLGVSLTVIRPFSALSKADVVRLGRDLPLQLTFSCIRPVDGIHCGRCNKCAERRAAFRASATADLTAYASDA